MTDDRRRHRTLVAWAFVAAPLIGAVVLGMLSAVMGDDPRVGVLEVFGGAVVGYLIALFLGIPAYFILRRRIRPRLIYVALVGALIASAPIVVVSLALGQGPPDLAEFQVAGLAFLSGAAGGLTFWLIAVRGDPHADRHFGPQKQEPADAFD
jgi:hypothetical protein